MKKLIFALFFVPTLAIANVKGLEGFKIYHCVTKTYSFGKIENSHAKAILAKDEEKAKELFLLNQNLLITKSGVWIDLIDQSMRAYQAPVVEVTCAEMKE